MVGANDRSCTNDESIDRACSIDRAARSIDCDHYQTNYIIKMPNNLLI